MKPYILKIAVIVFAFCFLKASAQEQIIPVGSQPAEIIRMGDDLHVFCSGMDMNGNGSVEEGDVEASWWIFDAATMNVKRSKVLEGGFLKGAPLNLAMNLHSTFLFHEKKIKRFKTENQELLDGNVISLPDSLRNIVSLNMHQEGNNLEFDHLILQILVQPNFTKNGVLIFADATNKSYSGFSQGKANPLQSYYFTTKAGVHKGTLVLAEGNNDSYLQLPMNTPALLVGNRANHILPYSDFGIICAFGSHVVLLVDLLKGNILTTIPTQTTGTNGPRECAIDGDNLYVTTYNCDIRKFSISTGEL